MICLFSQFCILLNSKFWGWSFSITENQEQFFTGSSITRMNNFSGTNNVDNSRHCPTLIIDRRRCLTLSVAWGSELASFVSDPKEVRRLFRPQPPSYASWFPFPWSRLSGRGWTVWAGMSPLSLSRSMNTVKSPCSFWFDEFVLIPPGCDAPAEQS